MLKLNTLLLLISAVIGLNKPVQLQSQQPAKQISFFDTRDTVVLKEEDYTVTQREAGFDLLVLNKTKLNKIAKLNNPQAKFISDNKVYSAIGLSLLSSRVPDRGDYFFPVNGYRRIVVFKGNILNFKMVGY
jgi:hypothetical protein